MSTVVLLPDAFGKLFWSWGPQVPYRYLFCNIKDVSFRIGMSLTRVAIFLVKRKYLKRAEHCSCPQKLVTNSVSDPDPGSGAFLIPWSVMGKKSGSGSGMNNPDHVSASLETIFWVKILKFFDLGSGIQDPGWKKFGSGINIRLSATLLTKSSFSLSDDLQSADSERVLPGVYAELEREHVCAGVRAAVCARHLRRSGHLRLQQRIRRLRLL
jgi:hypothetical protein